MPSFTRSLAFLALLLAGGGVGAAPGAVSNTSVILASSIASSTGEELSIVGELHVQATVQPSGGVEVQANVTQSALAFAVAGSALPEVDAIKARIDAIKSELVSLEQQLSAALEELEGIRQIDIFPDLPGLQFNEKRARELRAIAVDLQKRMAALQQELDVLFERLEQILDDLRDSRPDLVTLYTPVGADAVTLEGCTDDLVCEGVVSFDLVSDEGELAPLQIRLTLAFSSDGTLMAAEALACEIVCESDSGMCFCS